MRKTNFTIRSFRWLIPVFAAFMVSTVSMAQPYCSLSCNNDIQVSLNGDCEAPITYDMMLEDPWNPQTCSPNGQSAFKVFVMDLQGNIIDETEWVTNPVTGAVTIDPPVVTCDQIDEIVPIKVMHTATGNECWGTVIVEDKIKPVLNCPPVEIWCNEDGDPVAPFGDGIVPLPTVTDNCDNYPFAQNCDVITLIFADEWIDYGCVPNNGLSAQINRTWTATDASGNSTQCVQVVTFKRATIADVELPPHYDGLPGNQPAFDCESNCAQLLDGGDPAFNCTGYPSMHNIWVDVAGGYCEINVTYEDTRIDVCDGSFKILRDWTLVDWCTGEIVDYTQIIKVVDESTDIVCAAPWTVGTNDGPTSCSWSGVIPPATVNENCSGFTVVTEIYEIVPQPPYGLGTMEVLWATLQGNGGQVFGLPEGPHRLVYKIHDNCGNHDSCETEVTVEDDDGPTIICDEITQVTLGPDCTAIIYAETFDDGTHDNCCDDDELTFEVRRQGSSWGDFVEFGAGDCPGPVMTFLRATDCNGNTSEECMIETLVDDKTPPIITCPADKTIECWTDYNDLTLTGDATGFDACGPVTITNQNIQVNLNNCGVGFVRRRFTATDGKGNSTSCIQRINIVDSTPLSVIFPPDYTAFCTNAGGGGFTGNLDPSDLPAPFNGPNIIGEDCELVAVNNFDSYFPISDNACFKILREWIVIDWCIFDPNGPNDPSNGYYSSIQEIKVIDNQAPVVDCPDDYTVCIDGPGCTTTVDIPVPDADDCAPDDFLNISVFGDFNSFSTNNVAEGVYNATIRVEDGCNNKTDCEVKITVVDCKPPTPYCEEGLIVTLMPTGMVQIWASDFDEGSFDNCPGDLIFSFSSNVNNTGTTFDCGDLGENAVEIWVTDAAGNQDFCNTFVIIESNLDPDPCDTGDDPLIAGAINTEADFGNEPVEDVDVAINSADMNDNVMTTAAGFSLNVPAGGDYTVTPSHDVAPLNGVSTFDLVVMRKHILGTQTLDTPYKMIAADVNNSQSITTLDMVELRKVILLINPNFPNNTSWRFVETAYSFPNATNPWQEVFPEIININNINAAVNNADFVAVKIGDLNGNASTNGLLGADDRTGGTMAINAKDATLNRGEQVTVDFTAAEVAGFQFTLNFENLELVDVIEGVAKTENLGLTLLDKGAITTSWDGQASDDVLFSLTFEATAETTLSDALTINSRYTSAEAYTSNGDVMDVALNFEGTTAAGFELYQNTPNPFNAETTIGFNMPTEGAATLTVQDVSGKVIFSVNGSYAKGYNQVTLNANNLPATGVLYYTLSTGTETATQKMIMIK